MLTCSHFGTQYTRDIQFNSRPFVSQSILFVSGGRSSGWIRQSDRDILGKYLAEEYGRGTEKLNMLAAELRRESLEFIAFLEAHKNPEALEELYADFWQRLTTYYQPHIAVKYVVDYLDPYVLAKYLQKLQESRVAAEPVFHLTEEFLIAFCKNLSNQVKYNYASLLCLTSDEMSEYFRSRTLPDELLLETRKQSAVLLHSHGLFNLYVGSDVASVEKLVEVSQATSTISGQVAYPGKVSGVARIVNDPSKVAVFNVGDILVTGMTRPEFLSLMHKSGGFVTDAGGILSHAAITARELKKPCVIGTQRATKVLKDGDLVEVDADKGIVRIVGKT